jgi:HPt (histidine-containing phosphotransfer) domain-containing protein
LNEYPQQIQRLYEKQEMQAMRELVHKYKSSTAYLHFTPLNEILNKLEHPLEHSLKESDYAPLLEKVASFSAYIESAIQEKLGQ